MMKSTLGRRLWPISGAAEAPPAAFKKFRLVVATGSLITKILPAMTGRRSAPRRRVIMRLWRFDDDCIADLKQPLRGRPGCREHPKSTQTRQGPALRRPQTAG